MTYSLIPLPGAAQGELFTEVYESGKS